MKKLEARHWVSVVGGILLFVVLTEIQIPVLVVDDISIQLREIIFVFGAAVFGPIPGLVVGLVGHVLSDLVFEGQIWWSWAIADGVLGLGVGLYSDRFGLDRGSFGKKEILLFNLVQIFMNAFAWILLAPTLDVIFLNENAGVVYRQGLTAFAVNAIAVAVFTTLLNGAYAQLYKSKKK